MSYVFRMLFRISNHMTFDGVSDILRTMYTIVNTYVKLFTTANEHSA